jgi:hypothetical protein
MSTTQQLVSRTMPPSPTVRAALDAVAAVADQAPVTQDGPQALADVAALLQLQEQLRVTLIERLGDVQARSLHTLDGAGTTASWLRAQQTSIDAHDLPLARKLSRLPLLRRELQDGALAVKTVSKVAGSLERLRPHVDRPDVLIDGQPAEPVLAAVINDGVRQLICTAHGGLDDHDPRLDQIRAELADIASRPQGELARLEAAFLVLARHVEPAQLAPALAVLTDALLPSELDKRAAQGEADRGLTLTPHSDGSGWHVSEGDCDLELGELLNAVIQAQLAVDPENVHDTEAYAQLREQGWEAGDELPACGRRPRTLPQRRHDALKSALRTLLDSGALGTRDKVAPHVGVIVGIESLHGEAGSLPPLSTVTGRPLPLRLVRRWWCDSAATRFVMSLGRRVLETSHTERTLKAHERRAKQVETGAVCQGAGCSGHGTIPHHPDPWWKTGITSYREAVMLCKRTHHDVHDGKKTIRLKDGRWLNEHGWADGPDL